MFSMKKFLVKFYFFCVKIVNTIVSLLSVLLFSSFSTRAKLKKNRSEIKKNTECIILGNGPSVTGFLESIKNEVIQKDLFVLNFFGRTSHFKIIQPSYYLLIDPDLFSDNIRESIKNQSKDLVVELNQVSWKMILFVPARYKNSGIINLITNPNLLITPFNTTPISGFTSIEYFIFKKCLGMPVPESVIIASIFLAIYFQYEICHLYGVEHSWLKDLKINEKNQVTVGLEHFYKDSNLTDEKRVLSEFLLSQVRLFKSHMKLQNYSRHLGIKILNHTTGSYIDAYERVK